MKILSTPIILITFVIVVALFTSSCSTSNLYNYNNYSNLTYNYVQTPSDANLNILLKEYEQIINNSKGIRKVPAPGICADYGLLLIQKGEIEKGKQMLRKEIELYPESAIFVGRILKRFENGNNNK